MTLEAVVLNPELTDRQPSPRNFQVMKLWDRTWLACFVQQGESAPVTVQCTPSTYKTSGCAWEIVAEGDHDSILTVGWYSNTLEHESHIHGYISFAVNRKFTIKTHGLRWKIRPRKMETQTTKWPSHYHAFPPHRCTVHSTRASSL